MKQDLKTALRNAILIVMLDFIALPAGIALYFFHGFHILHVVLGLAYFYGLVLVYDTAVILNKHIRFVSSQDDMIHPDELTDYEPIKPEMKQAMDDVFGIKH